jgi:hypothetical protein
MRDEEIDALLEARDGRCITRAIAAPYLDMVKGAARKQGIATMRCSGHLEWRGKARRSRTVVSVRLQIEQAILKRPDN